MRSLFDEEDMPAAGECHGGSMSYRTFYRICEEQARMLEHLVNNNSDEDGTLSDEGFNAVYCGMMASCPLFYADVDIELPSKEDIRALIREFK